MFYLNYFSSDFINACFILFFLLELKQTELKQMFISLQHFCFTSHFKFMYVEIIWSNTNAYFCVSSRCFNIAAAVKRFWSCPNSSPCELVSAALRTWTDSPLTCPGQLSLWPVC